MSIIIVHSLLHSTPKRHSFSKTFSLDTFPQKKSALASTTVPSQYIHLPNMRRARELTHAHSHSRVPKREKEKRETHSDSARGRPVRLSSSLSPPRMFSVSHYHGPSQRLARTPGILISPVSPNLLTYLTCRAARYPATATAVRLLHTLQRGVYEDDSISAPVKSAGRFFRKGREVQGSFDN